MPAVNTQTSIAVTTETWKRLTLLKGRPSETFEEVVRRLLDEREQRAEGRSA